MKPMPEKLEEYEFLQAFAYNERATIIFDKLGKAFPDYTFIKVDAIIKVGSGLSDKHWGVLYGYILAWEEILE